MINSILRCFVLFLSVAFASCQSNNQRTNEQEVSTVNISSLLDEMIDRDELAKYPEKNFRLKQESSYNRASKVPEDQEGWFKNRDFNANKKDQNFIRIDTVNGQPEWVLMDHEGPGAIVRTWMPFKNPNTPDTDIIIKIYLDGATEPTLEGNMLGLLNGSGFFPYPFAHMSLRSSVSFFPIPYATSCKVTVTKRPFFYQFTFRAYDAGTDIESFTLQSFEGSKAQIEKVGQSLRAPQVTPSGEKIELTGTVDAGDKRSVDLPQGAGAVRFFSLKLDHEEDSLLYRSVFIEMSFDGKQTVSTPISEFFGTGVGLNPFEGWNRTVAEDGTMMCRWVMPYKDAGVITIINANEQEIGVDMTAIVGDWDWDDRSMYFHAGYRQQYPVSTRPYSDWNFVELSGRGVYVGDALTIWNPVERWWGEGDEKIWVDGEGFPSIFGTGTEDYYGYSWGGKSTDFYQHPFHAQPRAHVYNKLNRKITDERNTLGYSTETRTRGLDGMPFEKSLKLDMEIWHWEECEMEFAVGTYWYGFSDVASNVVPLKNNGAE